MTMQPDLPPYYDNLALTLAKAWDLVARGAADRRAAFHTPGLATVGLDGRPEARTVVLRAADPDTRTLRFHTDRRSAKFAEISHHSFVSMLFYDPAEKVQIRASGTAVLHGADSARARLAWSQSLPMSRACYAQSEAPGARIAEPISAPIADAAGADVGFENFVAVDILVERLEWLFLFHGGHRRAVFTWGVDGETANWLAP